MQGSRAGRMVERQQILEDGAIRLSSELELRIRRGPAVVELSVESQSVETAGGDLISLETAQRMGPSVIRTRWQVNPESDTVTITSDSPTGQTTRSEPFRAGGALAPAAASRFVADRIMKGVESIEVTTFDPSSGLEPVTITRTLIGREDVRALGKTVPATAWRVEQSVVPGAESVEYLDADGELVRGAIALGGIELVMLQTEREIALADDLEPPELLRSTLVRPSRPIDDSRAVVRARYRLTATRGELTELPTAGVQVFTREAPGSGEILVDLRSAHPARVDNAERAELLGDSAMIDPRDPRIRELAIEALRDAPADPAVRAETLRATVFRHMSRKNLDVGFASASDSVRTGEGDCTEHAVLLAALLRADGVPARVASGLIYADAFVGERDIFGFHMWTQALLEVDGRERWVDLDATLGPALAMDATHIALGVSSLAGSSAINTMAPLAPLLGALEIEVLETQP